MLETSHRNALESGYRLHWYRIEAVLGQGGFGITYLARDLNLDGPVALKEYLPMELAVRDDDQSVHSVSEHHNEQYRWGLQRFTDEARTLNRFDHPNIMRVHSVFEANNTAYMVMDYEEGESLEELLSRHEESGEERLVSITMALLDGLEVVHREGFIHRDIKPGNVYIRVDGSPVLLDFGSARLALVGRTRTVTAVVSSGYAPLEQYSSRSDQQGPWTDIYGLGATLYRAVAGSKPVDAVDRSRGILGSTRDILPPASEVARGRYSPGFLAAIDHALKLNERERPQTVAAWRDELLGRSVTPEVDGSHTSEQAAGTTADSVEDADEPGSARAATQFKPPTQRSFMRTRSVAGIAVALAVAVLVAWWQWGSSSVSNRASRPVVDTQVMLEDQRIENPLRTESSTAQMTEEARTLAQQRAEKEARDRSERDRRRAEEDARLKRELEQLRAAAAQREAEARRLAEATAERERRAQIGPLLAKAEADLQALHLTTPQGNNALEIYREVLKLEPDNAAASNGLKRIVQRYVELAHRAASEGDFAKAEIFLQRTQAVIPDAAIVLSAREELAKVRTANESEQPEPVQTAAAADEQVNRQAPRASQPPAEEESSAIAGVRETPRVGSATPLPAEPLLRTSRRPPFKIAILPIATNKLRPFQLDPSMAERDIQQLLHALVARNEAFTLYFSSYLEETDGPITTVDGIWEGTARRTPKAERVYDIGRKLGVDSVLMYFYEHYPSSLYIDERYTWQGYLFDVATQRAYQQQGDQANLRTNTKQLLSDFVEGRKDISRYKVAILPFPAAVGPYLESTSTREQLLDAINQALVRFSELRVIYSYYDPYEDYPTTDQFDGLWTGGVVNPELSDRRALQIVDSLGADVAFLCKTKEIGVGQVAFGTSNPEIECHLVDAHRRAVYSRKGVLDDAGEVTTALISEHLQLSAGSL